MIRWSIIHSLVADAVLDPAPGACQDYSRSRGQLMSVNGFQEHGRSSGSGPGLLPKRFRGSSGIPEAPVAVLPPIERLERIAAAVRRWCADSEDPRDHR